MRKVFTVIFVLCIVYFLGGWVGIHFGWIARLTYFEYAGLVGSLVSVVSLFALMRPALSKSDVDAIEIATLKSLTETTGELRSMESAKAKTRDELDELAIKKKQMELLVKKASLVLFLREQYVRHEQQVVDEIARNSRLRDDLDKATETAAKLKVMNEEVESDPNVEQLREIIASASRRQPTFAEELENLPPVFRTMFILTRTLIAGIERLMGNVQRVL